MRIDLGIKFIKNFPSGLKIADGAFEKRQLYQFRVTSCRLDIYNASLEWCTLLFNEIWRNIGCFRRTAVLIDVWISWRETCCTAGMHACELVKHVLQGCASMGVSFTCLLFVYLWYVSCFLLNQPELSLGQTLDDWDWSLQNNRFQTNPFLMASNKVRTRSFLFLHYPPSIPFLILSLPSLSFWLLSFFLNYVSIFFLFIILIIYAMFISDLILSLLEFVKFWHVFCMFMFLLVFSPHIPAFSLVFASRDALRSIPKASRKWKRRAPRATRRECKRHARQPRRWLIMGTALLFGFGLIPTSIGDVRERSHARWPQPFHTMPTLGTSFDQRDTCFNPDGDWSWALLCYSASALVSINPPSEMSGNNHTRADPSLPHNANSVHQLWPERHARRPDGDWS